MPVEFDYAARSDVGLRRSNNQDSAYAGPHLLVLCDGMGGPAGGDIASSVAVGHMVGLDTDDHRSDQMLPLLRGALNSAHDELVERSQVDPQLHGLGTTCIALMRSGNRLAMVHIGDSRAYVLRGGELTQVTTDHSLVQYLVEAGKITAEEAEHHPQRSVVVRILGDSTDGEVTPDESIQEAIEGDRWLLCSDGLSGVVSADTIADTLAAIADPGECCEELIRLALQAGGPDNVTCVVADVTGEPAATTTPQIVGAAAVDRAKPSRAGSSPAARAAALDPKEQAPADEDEDDGPRRRFRLLPFLTVVVVALVALGTALGYAWTQTQYYAQIKDGYVVIYQGIPQQIGPWALSRPVEVTDVRIGSLKPVQRDRLREPVRRDSREEIDAYVEQLRTGAQRSSKGGEPASTPSSDPSSSAEETAPPSKLPPSSQPTPRLSDSPSPRVFHPTDDEGDR